MRMWPEALEGASIVVEKIKVDERLPKLPEVRWAHQTVDRSVAATSGAPGDLRTGLRVIEAKIRHLGSISASPSSPATSAPSTACWHLPPGRIPTARAFARANPRRLARLRYDGRHLVGADLAEQLVEAAKRSVGQHHGAVYDVQARYLCQDSSCGGAAWPRSSATSRACSIATRSASSSPPSTASGRSRSLHHRRTRRSSSLQSAVAAYVGVVPGLRQSGQQTRTRAAIAPIGNARLRRALWMPVLGVVRRNPWLRAFHDACAPTAAAQARPHRRHAKAAPRRPQRRQE